MFFRGVLPASVLLEQPARLARLAGVMMKVSLQRMHDF
jgi:hypothetical protein